MLSVREKLGSPMDEARLTRRDRRDDSASLHVDLTQAAIVGRPEDDDVLAAPGPGRGATYGVRDRSERLGPGEGDDRRLLVRQHRFQLIARKKAYRLAVRTPEWIACSFRATKRPWIDRG